MGELVCLKCGAKYEADTFEQADELIDHSIGETRGHPCIASPLDLRWNDEPVASVVFHFGPGSKGWKAPGARKSESKKDAKSESTSSPNQESKKEDSTTAKSK